MNKESLDKYSKISIIVIAVILMMGFVGNIYSEVFIPHKERIATERINEKIRENAKKYQENQSLLNKCYANTQSAYYERFIENCTHKIGDGKGICINVSYENKDENCKDYFYCRTGFYEFNNKTKQTERKSCQEKYPLNF